MRDFHDAVGTCATLTPSSTAHTLTVRSRPDVASSVLSKPARTGHHERHCTSSSWARSLCRTPRFSTQTRPELSTRLVGVLF